ncbi:DNA-directed RNA polymerase I core subunit rpa12, partial [Blyttiomyces sp. JEL0837]
MQPKGHSLVFCKDCGTLVDAPIANEAAVTCRLCTSSVPASEFDALQVITSSKAGAFPNKPTPRKKDGAKEDESGHLRDGATIKEKCPKCEAPEMVFHTAQLRSADEGQTVFY